MSPAERWEARAFQRVPEAPPSLRRPGCALTESHPVVVAQAVHLLAEVLQHPGGHAVDVERRGRAGPGGERRLLQGHARAVPVPLPLRTAPGPRRGHQQRMLRAGARTAARAALSSVPPEPPLLRGCPHSLSQPVAAPQAGSLPGREPVALPALPGGLRGCFLLRLTSGPGPRCKSDFPFQERSLLQPGCPMPSAGSGRRRPGRCAEPRFGPAGWARRSRDPGAVPAAPRGARLALESGCEHSSVLGPFAGQCLQRNGHGPSGRGSPSRQRAGHHLLQSGTVR